MNDLTTSVMQHIKEIKSDMKELSVDIQSNLNVLSQDLYETNSNVDKLLVYSEKTQQEVSNLSDKMIKISSGTAKQEKVRAKLISFEDAVETELANVSDQKLQQDIKIEVLMKRIQDREGKIPDEELAMEEIRELKSLVISEFSLLRELKDLIDEMTQKNAKLPMDDSKSEIKLENFYYEEIKFETEEQSRKFISEMNNQDIEIKMETPTAPVEDEIISNALIYEFSDSNIPTILVKSEIIESEEPITKISEPKPQEIEEITIDHSEIVHEINLEANELEVIDSDVEKVETCVQNQQKLTEEKRTQLLNSWYDQ